MFDKNTIPNGLIIGILVPLIGFPLMYGLFTGLESIGIMDDAGFRPQFKIRTTAIIAIAINAYILNKFQAKRATDSMRGVTIATFIYVIVWMAVFAKTIL
ncbi:MAG: hypothetical protein NXI23_18965 [Bacteroidetes bacterium]|jgi:hypothetical protein|nr:hypothetical protein [Bacteroidota bacterium]MDF1864366.1 hypothetical protein [Saprospiraceae bacterium]